MVDSDTVVAHDPEAGEAIEQLGIHGRVAVGVDCVDRSAVAGGRSPGEQRDSVVQEFEDRLIERTIGGDERFCWV